MEIYHHRIFHHKITKIGNKILDMNNKIIILWGNFIKSNYSTVLNIYASRDILSNALKITNFGIFKLIKILN